MAVSDFCKNGEVKHKLRKVKNHSIRKIRKRGTLILIHPTDTKFFAGSDSKLTYTDNSYDDNKLEDEKSDDEGYLKPGEEDDGEDRTSDEECEEKDLVVIEKGGDDQKQQLIEKNNNDDGLVVVIEKGGDGQKKQFIGIYGYLTCILGMCTEDKQEDQVSNNISVILLDKV